MKVHIPVGLVLLSALVAGPALSQGADVRTADTENGYIYDFPFDDNITGDSESVPDVLKGGHHPQLTMLHRPRGSFVPEMLKSVETM